VSVDPAHYRDAAEVERARAGDPVRRACSRLAELGAADAALRIDAEAKADVDAALAAAEASPWPDPSEAYRDVLTTGEGRWR
jgi:pyruvate dehydrogenase E1 component alpha subunit